MDDEVRQVLECFRLNRVRECHRLLCEWECEEDAFTELVVRHNKQIVHLATHEASDTNAGLDLMKLFELLQDAAASRRTFVLSCGILYNATTCFEIGLPDLLHLYGLLLTRASRLCGLATAKFSFPRDPTECAATMEPIGNRLKVEDEEAFRFLTLATYGLAKRLLHEGRPQDCLSWIRGISVPGVPRSEEGGSWIRGTRGDDHTSLRSFCAVLSAICEYARSGPSPFIDGCLADATCPALEPYILYFRAHVRWELDEDPGPELHRALRRLPPFGHEDVRSSFFNLVGCHLAGKKKWHSALEYFHVSLEQQGDNLIALWNIASCYRSLGSTDKEQRALKLLFEEAFRLRCRRCNVVRPSRQYGRECRLSRGIATPWLSLAYCSAARLQDMEDYDTAAAYYGKIAEAHGDAACLENDSSVDNRLPVPDCWKIVEERAHCLLNCGRHEECRDVCTEMIAVGSLTTAPRGLSVSEDAVKDQLLLFRFYRGSALALLGDYAAALEDFRHALKELSSRESCACRRRESRGEAETAAKRPRLDEDSADDLLASVAEGVKDACQLCRMTSRLLVNTGVVHVLEGRREDAVHHMAGALLAWPGNVEAAHNLATMYAETGRTDTARAIREKFAGGSTGQPLAEECPDLP